MGCEISCRTLRSDVSFWKVLLCVISLNVFVVDCFNIDAFNYAVYQTEEDTMFGFTVAVHRQGIKGGWVLVGAPNAQSQYQPANIKYGGVVYKCRTKGDDVCQEIPFDRDGNQFFGNKEMDNKSGQWFGATLSASGNPSGGPVVACAPRYVWYSKEMNRRDPVGTCFVSDASFQNFEEYSPCRTSNWGYHRQGSCQAGFSAAINSIGDRLFVGAPGSYYWQGTMYSIDAHARFNYIPGLLGTTYGAKGSVHQQSLETRPAVFHTREGKQQDDDSYMGYSTIVGDFLGTGEQGIAVGMPRGSELRGKVLLFTWNLTNYKNISSSQMGSYFGYSLAAADIDGDSKLDLLVGAPMHTEPNTNSNYDVGRVYIFYQGGGYGSFNKSSFLDGMNSKSRFGHSLASLGDVNQDGYDDFAVGAPYDGENNRGAVYIYYGSPNGVMEKYGQVIYAEDIVTKNRVPVNTFGFSVTGGLDMDGNDYPDMAIGAYLSNAAFFFRSRPVVHVEAFVKFHNQNKQIDIKNKNCDLPNRQRGTCTAIDFCIKYSGKGIPQQLSLDVQYLLDTKKTHLRRMMFLRRNRNTFNETITLYKDRQDMCYTEEIYIQNDIRDKLTPMEAEVRFMIQDDLEARKFGRNPQSQLVPVLDMNMSSRKDTIIIQKNCGPDNVCIPDLRVNITKNVDKYLLDSKNNLELTVMVSNLEEDSFETTLELVYPDGVHYNKIENIEDTKGILCSSGENRTITCDIGNPLPAGKIAKFKVIFDPYYKPGIAPTYEFDVRVRSTNPEKNETLDDNHSHVTVDIWVDSTLDVTGRSIPNEIYLSNTSQYLTQNITRESEIGPQVYHVYTLRNKGPATIYEAEMYFLWPWQTLAGEDLLYLLEPPHVPEGVKCEMPIYPKANYKKFQLDYNPKPIWERLKIDSSSHYMGSSYESVRVESQNKVTAIAGDIPVSNETSAIDRKVSKSPGDASSIHEERHNASFSSVGGSSQGRWGSGSGQDSSGRISQTGETIVTKSEWHTVVIDGKPVTKYSNKTTVMDANGNVLRTYYSTEGEDQILSGSNVETSGGHMGGETQRKITEVHQSSGGIKGYANEPKFHEEHSYIVGGGAREGGESSTSHYDEHHIMGQGSLDSRHPQTSVGSTISPSLEEANEARRRYEERMQYEQRLRQQEEQRRKLEEERRKTSQNTVVSEEEERRKYELRIKQEEEEARRQYKEQIRLMEEKRVAEEQARRQAYLEQIKREEEIRRQQMIDEQKRRQQAPDVDSRRLQQQREEEEKKHREEEERRRQEEIRRQDERRWQYESEQRRQEEERRRQWSQQQSSAGSSRQQGGSSGSSARGTRVRTGSFDERGIYHDESGSSFTGRGGASFNHNWTADRTLSVDDSGRRGGSLGGHLDLGHAAGSGSDGFRTQMIDLGTVGGGGSSGSAGQAAGSGQWMSSGQRSRGGTFSGTLEGGISQHDQYNSEWERNNWETPTERPSDSNRYRGRREVPPIDPIDDLLKCTAVKCFRVKCVVGTMAKDDFISIVLRSRLNVRAVRQLTNTQPVKISSMMAARISKLPYIGKPKEQVPHSYEIVTDLPAGEQELTPQVVPLWIILLSAIAGTLILLLVILLLYKCGFFKRKRPSSAPERQPLRTNGYHTGD